MRFGEAQLGPFADDDLCRARWHSDDGGWFISADEMIFGIRIHLQTTTDPACSPSREVAYCCGVNNLATHLVPRIIMKILEPVPALIADDRGLAIARIRSLFPVQKRKPLDNDPDCWRELLIRADVRPFDLPPAAFEAQINNAMARLDHVLRGR